MKDSGEVLLIPKEGSTVEASVSTSTGGFKEATLSVSVRGDAVSFLESSTMALMGGF
jgi:hypothetical protein